MPEIWKDVVGYEGRYRVSSRGRVESLGARARILKLTHDHNGYATVLLYKGSKATRKLVKVHTLVLTAFVGPRSEDQQCRHLDGNPSNNRLGNLKWGTILENAQDREAHGTNRGWTLSEETKEKLSAWQKGVAKPHMFRKKSDETKRKISIAQKGKPRPYQVGRKASEETKRKQREAWVLRRARAAS